MFEDCGLGKTLQQLAWADAVHRHTNGDVLIIAPLAVAPQTVAEGAKFGIPVAMAREARNIRPGVNVVNYERLHLFDPARFAGVVLDESSILKAFMGRTKRALVTKPSIAGFGLNWQHCRASVSVGLSYSFEQRYQALRRIWRFGQTREVFDHVCMGPGEAKIFDSVMAKQAAHEDMGRQMAMSVDSATALGRSRERLELDEYRPGRGMLLPGFLASVPAASGMGVRA